MRVRYSPQALPQLDEIHSYISQRNPQAAKAVVARIEEMCDQLSEFSGMGTATDHPGVRTLPVVRYPYVIFYTLIAETEEVRILRIRHGRRRPLDPGEM